MISAVAALALLVAGADTPPRFSPLSPRQGDLALIYVEHAAPPGTKAHLEAFGYRFALLPAGAGRWRGALAVPLEAEIGPQPVRIRIGDVPITTTVDVSSRSVDREELQVSKKFTSKPNAALRARLKREEAEMQALWDAEPTPWVAVGPVVTPVSGQVTGNFATERLFNGKRKSVHLGLDLDGEEGDPVRAIARGTVVLSSLRFASGGTLVIDHGGGLLSMYFHLSRRDKKAGQAVEAGELIGAVGKTGRVTGPHLHLAVVVRAQYLEGKKAGEARSLYVDPAPVLALTLDPDAAALAGPGVPPPPGPEEGFGGKGSVE